MKIYFSGINGIGMSAIAKLLSHNGHEVKGSDVNYTPMSKDLEDRGIEVFVGQDDKNIQEFKPDVYIYSTAIKPTNKEYVYAQNNNIQMKRRGKALADVFNLYENTIAVAGTHGKTTTSSMMTVSFDQKEPYAIIGGIVPTLNDNCSIGQSDYFIAEADESDNSFLHLYPKFSVITNIEEDHLEHHGSLENIKKSFIQFIDQTKKVCVLSKDCPNISKLDLSKYEDKLVWYSLKDKKADVFADNIEVVAGITYYDVYIKGELLGKFSLKIPGLHNVSNSLAVIYLAYINGLDMSKVVDRIHNFIGAKRRFQKIYDEEITIIDDYAHHPTEIMATIKAARSLNKGKITVVFEPHRYTRVKFFLKDFAKALELADEILLLPIYAAAEENVYNISSFNLKDEIESINKDKKVSVMLPEDILNKIYHDNEVNDTYIFMGAGSISKFAYQVADKMKG